MRNLPDDELYSLLKGRLQNYEEQPDEDVWAGISTQVSSEPAWIKSVERASWIVLFLLTIAGWYAGGDAGVGNHRNSMLSHVDNAALSNDPTPSEASFATSPTDDSSSARLSLVDSANTREGLNRTASKDDKTNGRDDKMNRRDRSLNMRDPAGNRQTHATDMQRHAMNIQDDELTTHDDETPTPRVANDQNNGQSDAMKVPDEKDVPNEIRRMQHAVAETQDDAIKLNHDTVKMNVNANRVGSYRVDSAQASVVPVGRRKLSWQLYAVATPSLAFQQVTPSRADEVTFLRLNSPGVLASERLAVAFEAGVQFPVVRRLQAFAGFTYFRQWMDLSLEVASEGNASVTSHEGLDFQFSPSASTTVISYHLQNVGATAGLLYSIAAGKIRHQLGASLQYELGLHAPAADADIDVSRNSWNYRILYRAEYNVARHITLFVQPSFVQSLSDQDLLNGAIRVKQRRAGMGVGFTYRF